MVLNFFYGRFDSWIEEPVDLQSVLLNAECKDGVEGMGICVLPLLFPGLDCLDLLLLGAKLIKFRFLVSAALDKLCVCSSQFSSTQKWEAAEDWVHAALEY